LKTIAAIRFLLGSYVDCRKISHEVACQDFIGRGQGHFWRVQGHSVRPLAILLRVVGFDLQRSHYLVQLDVKHAVIYRKFNQQLGYLTV